jgi:ABC-2 type transport system permease protein
MFNIICKEIKELFADKKIWIGILTVLIILIIGTSYNRQKPEKPVSDLLRLGVINKDISAYSDLLGDYFTGSKTFASLITVMVGEETEIKEAFHKGELDIYLEVPENFAENMIHLEHSPVKVTLNISDTTKAILLQNVLKSYEKYIAAVEANAVGLYEIMEQDGMDQELITDTNRTVSLDLIFTALGKEAFFTFKPVSQFPVTTLPVYYIGSILVMALLYSGLYAGFQLLREMKQGTFMRLRTTGTPLLLFLTAKMAIVIIFLTAALLGAVTILCQGPLSPGGILFCLAVTMFCVSMAVLLSALFPATQRFVLAGNLLIFYFTVLGGGIIPIQFLPQDLLLLSKATPYFYILKGILDINQGMYWKLGGVTAGFLLIAAAFLGASVFLLMKRRVIYDEV